jgi:hypothetical protein
MTAHNSSYEAPEERCAPGDSDGTDEEVHERNERETVENLGLPALRLAAELYAKRETEPYALEDLRSLIQAAVKQQEAETLEKARRLREVRIRMARADRADRSDKGTLRGPRARRAS